MGKNYKMVDNDSSKSDIGFKLLMFFIPPVGWFTWGILGLVGWGVFEVVDEKRAEYTQTQDTVLVTGIHKDMITDQHARNDNKVYKYTNPNVFARGTGKNGKEYDMAFKSYDGSEAGFVERGDSIVVNFTYRNGERHKDSVLVNLTRQKMIRDAIKSQVR